jgi:hypothetical protein
MILIGDNTFDFVLSSVFTLANACDRIKGRFNMMGFCPVEVYYGSVVGRKVYQGNR